MSLPDKLLALHDALDAAGEAHAFGGAIALAYCTHDPRGTRDIDVNAFVPASSPQLLLDALPAQVKIGPQAKRELIEAGQIRLYADAVTIADVRAGLVALLGPDDHRVRRLDGRTDRR